MSSKGGYQEIIASFFKEVGTSEAHWYSLKPLHSEIPSLADLQEVSAENLQGLLVKGGLGKLGGGEKTFSFQASQFDSFWAVFMIQEDCQVMRCKIKGLKTKQSLVRLGSLNPSLGNNNRAARQKLEFSPGVSSHQTPVLGHTSSVLI